MNKYTLISNFLCLRSLAVLSLQVATSPDTDFQKHFWSFKNNFKPLLPPQKNLNEELGVVCFGTPCT